MSTLVRKVTNKQGWARFFSTLKYALYVMTHPFDGFWDLIHEKRGSLAAANFLVFMTLVTRLMTLQYTNFMFNHVYWPEVNILQQCLSILLPLGIFCVCNWGLTTLFDGKGRLKDVYMATAYALAPYVILQLISIPISNVVTADESVFVTVLNGLGLIWSGMLIITGMMMIHDYSLGKTLLFLFITIIGMAIVIFLLLLFFSLVGDGVGYFASLYKEVVFRLY